MRLCLTLAKQVTRTAPFLWEISDGIAAAQRLGYDCVEMHVSNPNNIDIESLMETLNRHNVAVSALGTGRAYVDDGLSLIDDDIDIRSEAIQRLKHFILLAKELKSLVIIGCIRGNIPDYENYGEYTSLLGESMRDVDRFACEHDVTVVFEPINRYENNFLCNMSEIAEFIQSNSLTNTKMMMDTFHMNIEEANILESIQKYSHLIKYVHAADSNRLYPGGGHIDFATIFKMLKECGYSGDVSAECLPLPDKETAAKKFIATIKNLI